MITPAKNPHTHPPTVLLVTRDPEFSRWLREPAGAERDRAARGQHGAEPTVPERAVARWVRILQATARSADVLGRLGPGEFAVVAPATGPDGVLRLARRLERALGELPRERDEPRVQVRVGYDAVENMAYAPINAIELLGRANLPERKARSGTTGA